MAPVIKLHSAGPVPQIKNLSLSGIYHNAFLSAGVSACQHASVCACLCVYVEGRDEGGKTNKGLDCGHVHIQTRTQGERAKLKNRNNPGQQQTCLHEQTQRTHTPRNPQPFG